MKTKYFALFLILIFASFFASSCSCTKPEDKEDDGVFVPSVSSVGVWWWHETLGEEYLDFASKNGVTEIYYSASTTSLDTIAKPFIKKAGAKNIKVYLLLGDFTWIINPSGFKTRMDRYVAYQSTASEDEKFAGVHLDVEPHQHPDFKTNRTELLQKYIDFAVKATNDYGAMDYDIPFWFTDAVVFNGESTPLYKAIIKTANRVFIMSYRDSASKMYNLGSVPTQIEYAKSLNKQIFLSAECNYPNEDGVVISFADKGKQAMYTELNQLKELANYDKLGISIHHIKTWFSLKD